MVEDFGRSCGRALSAREPYDRLGPVPSSISSTRLAEERRKGVITASLLHWWREHLEWTEKINLRIPPLLPRTLVCDLSLCFLCPLYLRHFC